MRRSHRVNMTSTEGLSREQWLALRNQGIGSSDAAAAVGLSPYKSALELWLEKTGRKEANDLSENEAVFWGTTLEPIIADVYAERTGARIRKVDAILEHADHPFMLANLDRYVLHPTDRFGVLEIKTAGLWSSSQWEDTIPEGYQCQVLHQLAVTGKEWADVAVLIGGQDFRVYRIHRDEPKIADLIDRERQFWQHVVDDTPPPTDGSESSGNALSVLHPKDNGEAIDFSESTELNDLFRRLVEAKAEKDFVDHREAELRQQLMSAMGPASSAIFANGKVSWKLVKGQTGTDFKKLSEEHPDLVSSYSIRKPGHRRFMVQIAA